MRRFKVTVIYEVDTACKGTGRILGTILSARIAEHTRGEGTSNLVTETDFSFKEIIHPKESDRA